MKFWCMVNWPSISERDAANLTPEPPARTLGWTGPPRRIPRQQQKHYLCDRQKQDVRSGSLSMTSIHYLGGAYRRTKTAFKVSSGATAESKHGCCVLGAQLVTTKQRSQTHRSRAFTLPSSSRWKDVQKAL